MVYLHYWRTSLHLILTSVAVILESFCLVYTHLCCVLFSSMVNKSVGGAWCNWNEPVVMNHSRIWAKPREGGHLAARLTDSLRVSTEKLRTPSSYTTDSVLKVCHKCSLYVPARTSVYLSTVFRPASITHGRHGSCPTNLRTSRHWSVFPVKGTETCGHAIIGKGTPLKTNIFWAYFKLKTTLS